MTTIFLTLLGFFVVLVIAEVTRPARMRLERKCHEWELAHYERGISKSSSSPFGGVYESAAADCRDRIRRIR